MSQNKGTFTKFRLQTLRALDSYTREQISLEVPFFGINLEANIENIANFIVLAQTQMISLATFKISLPVNIDYEI